MFVGHYAAGLALKKYEKRASLGVLFLAVQFVDILFFPFVLLGIERINIKNRQVRNGRIYRIHAADQYRQNLCPATE